RTAVCQGGTCARTPFPACPSNIHVEELATTFGGTRSSAVGINDSGVAVGFGWDATSNYKAARWFPGDSGSHLLNDDPRAFISSAHAINNAGVIAGRVGVNTPFRYFDPPGMGFDLIAPTVSAYAVAINDSNSVAGFRGDAAGGSFPFIYTDARQYREF